MAKLDELKTAIRRNMLLGIWAAEKLGLVGREAHLYAEALAVGTVDPQLSDVFSTIRKDFDVAGVVESDEQILRVMNKLLLEVGSSQTTQAESPDAAAVLLARNLTLR